MVCGPAVAGGLQRRGDGVRLRGLQRRGKGMRGSARVGSLQRRGDGMRLCGEAWRGRGGTRLRGGQGPAAEG
jgi:hypothetical protein